MAKKKTSKKVRKPVLKRVFLLIETQQDCGRDLIFGIAKYSRLQRHWEFFAQRPFYFSPNVRADKVENVDFDKFDGAIVYSSFDKARYVLEAGIPAVVWCYDHAVQSCGNLRRIESDHVRIGQLAWQHFADRGFQHLAYCGFENFSWSKSRERAFAGYVEADSKQLYLYRGPRDVNLQTESKERPFLRDWLLSLPRPVGILTCNDERGRHLIEVCKELDLKVPEQIAILGVDNDTVLCELCDPPLSSVVRDYTRGGYEVAERLDQLMRGEPVDDRPIIVSSTHVQQRQSTDVLAIEDTDVALAVRFIRDHVLEPIQVSDVVEASSVSRRLLEIRFRKIFKRTILDEIHRVRVEHACRLLEQTNMTVLQIVHLMKFTDANHISRWFRKLKGISPLEYRKKYGLK